MMADPDDLIQRLRRLGMAPIEPSQSSADLTAMAGVIRRPRRPSALRSGPRVAAAFFAGLLLGSTGLAAADALPDPAQHVAHTMLARVGVEVPNPDRYHGPECGPEVKRNHGAYVRDDHALAQTDCGKPVGAGGDDADDADEADSSGGAGSRGAGQADKGPCHGKPPWAGQKSMTPEEVAAAKTERAAVCGTDDDDAQDEVGDVEDEAEDDADEGADVEGVEGTTTTTVTETATTTTTTTTTTTPTTEAPTTTTEATTTTSG